MSRNLPKVTRLDGREAGMRPSVGPLVGLGLGLGRAGKVRTLSEGALPASWLTFLSFAHAAPSPHTLHCLRAQPLHSRPPCTQNAVFLFTAEHPTVPTRGHPQARTHVPTP